MTNVFQMFKWLENLGSYHKCIIVEFATIYGHFHVKGKLKCLSHTPK